ncbi:MAG: NAD-dependent epimerase/dehydratase family protein, partial [Psychrobacillus psychrodurans]
MRVLITGGYGFIGSHVADRYYKEGYEVFIIDDLSTGNRENITFKHKGYILSVKDPKCEEIFKSYQFDVVVHLAAQVSVAISLLNPREDIEINVVGLVNILTLSQRYKVKKFIFASSAAVYGFNDHLPLKEEEISKPISPYGISKWMGEEYCQKWRELHDFESVCFRFSNVYGPRQSNVGEGGVISIYLDRIINNQPLDLYGDGEQTRDFIYVEDVSDAIFRASHSTIAGIYNLSTNMENSINNIIDKLKNIHGDIRTNNLLAREGDIYKSVLSNQKVMDALDWSPMYDMEAGLERTYSWA